MNLGKALSEMEVHPTDVLAADVEEALAAAADERRSVVVGDEAALGRDEEHVAGRAQARVG